MDRIQFSFIGWFYSVGVLFDHLPFLTPKAGEWWDDAVCFWGFFFLCSKLKFKWKRKRKARGKRGGRMRKLQYIVMLLWCWWWACFIFQVSPKSVLTSFHCHTFFCSEKPNVVLTFNVWKILLYKIILKIKLYIHVLHFGVYDIN